MRNSSLVGPSRFRRWSFGGLWWTVLLWGLSVLFVCLVAMLVWKWPFRDKAVVAALETESNRTVRIGSFRQTFFPPGYVAEKLVLLDPSQTETDQDTVTAQKMVVVARWSDLLLLRRRVRLVLIAGLRMQIRLQSVARDQAKQKSANPPRFAEIGQFKLEDAVFAFPTMPGEASPFAVKLQVMTFDQVSRVSGSPFHAHVLLNEPDAAVRSEGQAGPWNWSDPGKTPLSGSFVLEKADLSGLGGVAGTLTGSGKFRGPLQQVVCNGILEMPELQVASNVSPAHLSTTFRADVNGLNGDTKLEKGEVRLNRTLIESTGTVASDGQRPGKAVSLQLSVQQGYIQDVLSLFAHDGKPAMTGQVSMRASVGFPAGPPGFVEKVKAVGDFTIDNGRFTNPHTQTDVDRLSMSAMHKGKNQGKPDPKVVLLDIMGHVAVQQGAVVLSHAGLTVPGANATVSGTCNLIDKQLDFHGLLKTTGKLADTTSGSKAALLEIVSPFWKKKKSTTFVPFTILGTTRHPDFRLDLLKK